MLRICSLFVAISVALVFAPVPGVAQTLTGRARVIDGDTLALATTAGGQARIRLHGIDAPEARQTCPGDSGGAWPCGDWATGEAAALSAGTIACTRTDTDRYGRIVARCRNAEGRDIGAALVAAGAAIAYREYSTAYLPEERAARAAGRGIWAVAGMIMPAAFRAGNTGGDAGRNRAAPVPGCAIKGNLSGGGAIYHRPGQRDYARTRIDPARGERWFCSAVEAEAAGWRAARR